MCKPYEAMLHKNNTLISLTLLSMHFAQGDPCFCLVLSTASYVLILNDVLYIQFPEQL